MQSVPKKVTKRKMNTGPDISKNTKVKKVDTLKVKKSSTKADLLFYIEGLEQKYDALEKKHNESIDKIKSLEMEIIKSTEKNEAATKETQTISDQSLKCIECNFEGVFPEQLKWHMNQNHGWPEIVQTQSDKSQRAEDMDISTESQGARYCVICDYEAEDMYDLEAHHWSEHEEVDEVDHTRRKSSETFLAYQKPKYEQRSIGCNLCDDKFETRDNLMKHKKINHNEKVAACWNFSSGYCEFGEETCWFNHSKDITSKPAEFKCNLCGKDFLARPSFLEHRKNEHKQVVKKCNNASNGKCRFGSQKCWFLHENAEFMNENSENIIHENNVIQKIMKMMETFTKRILKLEENNLN